jgi:hypothetical protein
MHRRFPISLNADDRATIAKWWRGVIVFYLIVVAAALVMLPKLQGGMNATPAQAIEASAAFGNPLP